VQDNEFVDGYVDTFVDLSVTPYRFARQHISAFAPESTTLPIASDA
jgi:hypothetical protein